MTAWPERVDGVAPGGGEALDASHDHGVCTIVIHPSGRLDRADSNTGFWAEVPDVPDCGGLAAATPGEVFALTVAEVRRWSRSRAGAAWHPVPPDAVFVAVHAW